MAGRDTRLIRVREGRIVGGVASGLARYLNLDVTLVRLAFVVLTLINGVGVLIYVIMWILMPDEEMAHLEGTDSMRANVEDIAEQAQRAGERIGDSLSGSGSNRQVQLAVGVGLMGLGLLFLVQQLGLLSLHGLGNLLWPAILIVVGVALLTRRARGE